MRELFGYDDSKANVANRFLITQIITRNSTKREDDDGGRGRKKQRVRQSLIR